jgi:CheY-like chemotaxis protein
MNPVHSKALERACELAGGPAALAHQLKTSVAAVEMMLAGQAAMTPAHFDVIVDLLLKADVKSLGAPLVLVVEDDAPTAYSISRLIRQAGYRAEIATDGASALEHIRTRKPAVAFIDIRLPDRTGWEIAETVRREGLPTQLIAVTAFAENHAEQSLAAGFYDHLVKPLDKQQLERFIPKRYQT